MQIHHVIIWLQRSKGDCMNTQKKKKKKLLHVGEESWIFQPFFAPLNESAPPRKCWIEGCTPFFVFIENVDVTPGCRDSPTTGSPPNNRLPI